MVVRQSDSGRKVENGVWHLFVFALSRILKKRGKRRKTKKTRENLGFFGRHLLRPEHLARVYKKDALLLFSNARFGMIKQAILNTIYIANTMSGAITYSAKMSL